MVDFSVSSPALQMEPVKQTDLPPIKRAGRGPSYDYFSWPQGPREYAARNQAAGAFASGIRSLAEKANEMSLTHWLQVWLRNNEPHIIREMDINHHSVFVAQFNYTVTDGEVRTYMVRGAYLLGTVTSRADIGKILTPEALYGPSMRETVPNGTLYQIAYLVGGRKQVVGSAGKTGSASSLVG
ncbi:hypothetical protein FP026_24665 [Rhizobium tropici]|uniref:Uncharacterized protein n=1 Tax=Rhizobium tropici TaxID=398 RepID=A0A5B0VRW7_RHITR|nr:hypothetical protein [Rhizobium tropici]KAA1177376.1 hypothetical protein FP026_24665 [Rhizobium tropici]